MSEISTERGRVIVASESSYGTNAVDAIYGDGSTDIIWQDVRSCDIVPAREIIEIGRYKASHSGTKHCSVPDVASVNLEIPLTARVGSGSGDEAPYYADILKAMNLSEAISDSTSATYTPVTQQQSAMSIHQYMRNLEDANWRQLYALGVRGTGTFNFQLNEEAFFTFEGQGIYQDELSTAAAYIDSSGNAALESDGSTGVAARAGGTEAVADASPMCVNSMTFTIGGTTYDIASLELSLNWTVAVKRTVNGDGNAQEILLTRALSGARIGGSFDLQDGNTALNEMLADLKADTASALVVSLDDGTDRIRITASNLQFGVPSRGDNSGILTHTVPFYLNGSGGLAEDDDFSLIYDAAP